MECAEKDHIALLYLERTFVKIRGVVPKDFDEAFTYSVVDSVHKLTYVNGDIDKHWPKHFVFII